MASIGMRSLTVGGQPEGYAFDAHHYPLMRMLVAAKAHGLQAIDGPYARIHDTDGLRAAAGGAAALGYDGKWVLHPASGGRGQRGVHPVARRLRAGGCASLTPTSGPRRSTGAARSCLTAR